MNTRLHGSQQKVTVALVDGSLSESAEPFWLGGDILATSALAVLVCLKRCAYAPSIFASVFPVSYAPEGFASLGVGTFGRSMLPRLSAMSLSKGCCRGVTISCRANSGNTGGMLDRDWIRQDRYDLFEGVLVPS